MARLMISGAHSGCGKTTVACALLQAWQSRGLQPAAWKCGPDYIDPMFHSRAIGVPSHNLDPFFSTPTQLRQQLAKSGSRLSLLEGAMGYYDGVGPRGKYSAWDVARATDTPAVLVLDMRGMYASAGAVLKGFLTYRQDSRIRGVIFNNAPAKLYPGLAEIAAGLGLQPLGHLPKTPEAAIGSRHLGLLTAGEISDLGEKLARLASLAEEYLAMDSLLALAAVAPPLAETPPATQPLGPVRLAVAWDEAFCFLYQENLELLRSLGAELVFFSPLRDMALPPDIGGLYLCGGYPELHLPALAGNTAMLRTVKEAIAGGLPAIAECGGFLYLHERLDGHSLAGVIPAKAGRGAGLSRFGYVTLQARQDNLLCAAGTRFPAHEFHYYESEAAGRDFMAEKPLSDQRWPCVHATDTLYAGFPHLYFPAAPAIAENFVQKALAFGAGQGRAARGGLSC